MKRNLQKILAKRPDQYRDSFGGKCDKCGKFKLVRLLMVPYKYDDNDEIVGSHGQNYCYSCVPDINNNQTNVIQGVHSWKYRND